MSRTPSTANSKPPFDRAALSESEKWRVVVDNSLKMLSVGLLCGGGVSLIAFRSLGARAATMAFGAGCGLGKSYVDAKYILGHDISAAKVWTAVVAQRVGDDSQNDV